MIKDSIIRLSFDVTRKCNLNCKRCCKGEKQNVDISKEIVDKAIEEMKGKYIYQIRFFGGEPFLNPDMIEYIIDQLIEKHILFDGINVFTNGTVKSGKITEAFKRALKYFDEIKCETAEIRKAFKFVEEEQTQEKKIVLLVSGDENANTNIDEVNETINFYVGQIQNDRLWVTNPYNREEQEATDLEGLAEKNYMELLQIPVSIKSVRKVNNRYCFLKRYVDDFEKRFISKTLSISTDGKVYVGCSLPYERMKNEYMFKINECNNDFFDKVEEYCFNHNVCERAHKIREQYDVWAFLKSKNIPIKDMNEQNGKTLAKFNELISTQEQVGADLHKFCPSLYLDEVELMSIAVICLNALENDILSLADVQLYLINCTELDSDSIKSFNIEYLRGLILFLTEKDKKRREEKKGTT